MNVNDCILMINDSKWRRNSKHSSSRVRAETRADAPRQLDSWNALDLNGKMQRGPLKSMGPEAESYTRLLRG